MRIKKAKKVKKFRLLLDAAFARPSIFRKLSSKANVTHVVWDLGKSNQISDEEIYQLATQNERFVVTINYRDFKKLVKTGGAGIFGVPPYLSNEEMDEVLTNFLAGKNPIELWGKAATVLK